MADLLAVLPMTFVMIAGPQIVSSVFLATSDGWARNSAAYLAGAALSITIALTVTFVIVSGSQDSPGERSQGSEGETLDAIILVLLLLAAAHVFRTRKTSQPPKWMGKLQDAKPGFAFKLGFLLLGVFPTDILTSIAVGMKLAREGAPWWHTLLFVALTLLLLAIPALLVVILGTRAREVLPKVRTWMNDNAWMVSEGVIALFVVIELNSLLGA